MYHIHYVHRPSQDCDNAFIRRFLHENYPRGFVPIWATDNLTEVTSNLRTTKSDFFVKYQEIVTGSMNSGWETFSLFQNNSFPQSLFLGCPLPCTETLVKTVFMDEFYKTSAELNVSRIDIVFYHKVDMTIRDFPIFNFASFLASLGGTLGLWLGLGILQLLDSIIPIFKDMLCRRKEINVLFPNKFAA